MNGRAVASGRLLQARSGKETLGISRHRETGQEINGRPHQARSGLEIPGTQLVVHNGCQTAPPAAMIQAAMIYWVAMMISRMIRGVRMAGMDTATPQNSATSKARKWDLGISMLVISKS